MMNYNLKALFAKYKNGKIAVVGNSDNIYDKEYGDQIDGYDCVIRFNTCYVDEKTQKYTGNKTDIIVLGASVYRLYLNYRELYDRENDDNKISKNEKVLRRYVEKFPGADYILSEHHVKESRDLNLLEKMTKRKAYIYPHKMSWKYYREYGLRNTPTCGMVMLMFLLSFKKELNLQIDIYGFNKEEKMPIIYEYYVPTNNKEGHKIFVDKRAKVHNLLTERKIIKSLIKSGEITQY